MYAGPAFTLVCTLSPAAVWLWFRVTPPALTLDLTFNPAAVWLWLYLTVPAFTLVLVFIVTVFLCKLCTRRFVLASP